MEFQIGEKVKSKVNQIFTGFYIITNKNDRYYELTAYDSEDKKTFINPKYGVYKKSKKWVEKNCVKIN